MSAAQRSRADSTAAPALLRSGGERGEARRKALARSHGGCALSWRRSDKLGGRVLFSGFTGEC